MKNLLITMSILTIASLQAEAFSVKTSVNQDDCIVTESSEWLAEPEIDYLTMFCPGFDSYGVEISGGDIRYNLKLSYKGKKVELENLSGFHDLDDDKIEWRYTIGGQGTFTPSFKYTSLIYSLNFQAYDEEKGDMYDDVAVYVVKLDGAKSCTSAKFLVSKYASKEAATIEARKHADETKLTCSK